MARSSEEALVVPRLRLAFFVVYAGVLQVRSHSRVRAVQAVRLEEASVPYRPPYGVPERKGEEVHDLGNLGIDIISASSMDLFDDAPNKAINADAPQAARRLWLRWALGTMQQQSFHRGRANGIFQV